MAVEYKDYYRTLGVPRTASDEEIRKAFRKLARQHHPDVAKNKISAEEKFKEINEAYEVLGDPEKRKRYDQLGANWNRAGGFAPPPGWKNPAGFRKGRPGESFESRFGGTGFSDFFEQFFGSRNGEFAPRSSTRSPADGRWPADEPEPFVQRGGDVEGDILVTLDEVLHGAVRTVSLQRENPKTGAEETQSFRVKIPPGVQEGQIIRVAGKGEPGMGGGTAGDLYLRAKLGKHPDFQVRGADLFCDLELAPWEAVLGTTVSVPALDGALSLKVQPGMTTGQQLRVRGRGLPTAPPGKRGDFYAVISIQAPTRLTSEEKILWERLAKESTFNPRRQ